METRRRNSFVWPVILISIGVLLLLSNLGIMDVNIWALIVRLWPLILIAVGVDILVGRRSGVGGVLSIIVILGMFAAGVWFVSTTDPSLNYEITTKYIDQALNGATEADISISFGVGELYVGSHSKADSLIQGVLELLDETNLRDDFRIVGDKAVFTLRGNEGNDIPPRIFTSGIRNESLAWELKINNEIPVELNIDTGVGRSVIDLRGLLLTGLELNLGVGQMEVFMPAEGDFTGRIEGGVGELIIRIPASTAIRVRVNTGLGGVSVQGDFNRSGDTYTSNSFDPDADYIELFVSGGIGSIVIRQIDG